MDPIISDAVLHLLNAIGPPGIIGVLGVKWLLQKRNGNKPATCKDIENLEEVLGLKIGSLEQKVNNNFNNTATRLEEIREWCTTNANNHSNLQRDIIGYFIK